MGFVLSKKDLLNNEEVNRIDVYFNLDEINAGEPKTTEPKDKSKKKKETKKTNKKSCK